MWEFSKSHLKLASALFPGWIGIVVGACVSAVIAILICGRIVRTRTFIFESRVGDFEEIMKAYLDIAKFILTLAAGGIVLIISSTSLGTAKKLPESYATPLFILVMSMLYGILFMPLLVLDYEAYKHDPDSYTRFRYIRNQTLGIASLACFCLGYGWLIFAAARN